MSVTVPLTGLLARSKSIQFVAQGRSMWPFIQPGDVVRVGPPIRLQPGAVVLAEDAQGNWLLHRLVAFNGGRVMLRGDNRSVGDGWFDRRQIIGRLRSVTRRGLPVRSMGRVVFALAPLTRRWDRARTRVDRVRQVIAERRAQAEQLIEWARRIRDAG